MTNFITSAQLAKRLQLSPATVSQYAKAGRIAGAQKWGNRWRFDTNALRLLPPDGEVTVQRARPSTAPLSQRRVSGEAQRFPHDMTLKQRLAETRLRSRRKQ